MRVSNVLDAIAASLPPEFMAGESANEACGFEVVTERESAEEVIDLCANSSHPLAIAFGDALKQAVEGKGEQRHGAGRSYLDQPWVELARDHGAGFLTGQAAKKIKEAVSNKTEWSAAQYRAELLGAMNYLGMAVVFNDLQDAVRTGEIDDPELAIKLGVTPDEAVKAALAIDGFDLFGPSLASMIHEQQTPLLCDGELGGIGGLVIHLSGAPYPCHDTDPCHDFGCGKQS
jgi:hypothetical protein